MSCTRAALILLVTMACLGAPPSRAGIRCAIDKATAGEAVHHGSDVVPCADEKQGGQDPGPAARSRLAENVSSLIGWIVAKTGWTERDAPPIKFVSREKLDMMYGENADGLHVEALYSDKDHSIYLPEGWKVDGLRNRSVLLHELVHHLQYLNHAKVTCESEYEYQALKLQLDWLVEQGVEDPFDMLGIDPPLLLLLGQCDEMSY